MDLDGGQGGWVTLTKFSLGSRVTKQSGPGAGSLRGATSAVRQKT